MIGYSWRYGSRKLGQKPKKTGKKKTDSARYDWSRTMPFYAGSDSQSLAMSVRQVGLAARSGTEFT